MAHKGWQCVASSGPAPSAAAYHTMTLWEDEVLLYGSEGLARLDLNTMTWSTPATADSPGPRTHHSCVLHRSCLLLYGGTTPDKAANGDFWILALTPPWAPALRHAVHRQQPGGRLDRTCLRAIAGFADTPLSWQRRDTGGVIEPRHGHSAVLDAVGRSMVVFGGSDGTFCLDTTYRYDLEEDLWEQCEHKGPAPPSRADHTAVLVGRRMFVFGGAKYRTYMNDLWALNLATETWEQLLVGAGPPHVPTVRFGHSMVVLQDAILVYGGHTKGLAPNPKDRCVNDLWMWDLKTNSWTQTEARKTTKPPPPTVGHRAVVWQGALWVFGGRRDDAHPASQPEPNHVWVFRLATESQSASCAVQ